MEGRKGRNEAPVEAEEMEGPVELWPGAGEGAGRGWEVHMMGDSQPQETTKLEELQKRMRKEQKLLKAIKWQKRRRNLLEARYSSMLQEVLRLQELTGYGTDVKSSRPSSPEQVWEEEWFSDEWQHGPLPPDRRLVVSAISPRTYRRWRREEECGAGLPCIGYRGRGGLRDWGHHWDGDETGAYGGPM